MTRRGERRGEQRHCSVELLHWSRYLDGEFAAAECRRCEAHLATCARCRQQLRGLKQTMRACREAGRTAVPPEVRAQARKRVRKLMGS